MINNDMIIKTMLISTLMIQNDKNDDNFFSFNLKMFFIVSPKSTYNQQQHCRHINLFNSILLQLHLFWSSSFNLYVAIPPKQCCIVIP